MLPDLLALAVVAAVLAVTYASRRLRRVMRAEGGPPARPAPHPAGRAAVPEVVIQPSSVMTGPFGYDNGVTIGRSPVTIGGEGEGS